ncbi:MAG: hypothetical protein V4643_08955 [Bacteroidota bacterium]
MKKSLIAILTIGYVAGSIMFGCNSPAKKVENAKEELKDAKQELNQAREDSITDYENFKIESEQKINNNKVLIEEYKTRMITDKKSIKAKDQKIIDDLEQKNLEMRKKIWEYKGDKDNWEAFKTEFNHDMDQLGNAIKSFTVKNTK